MASPMATDGSPLPSASHAPENRSYTDVFLLTSAPRKASPRFSWTSERAASSIGINVARAKLTAFGLSAFLAGVGGALIGYQRQIISARSFGLFDSMIVIAIVYLAGISMPSGALLAGVIASGGLLTVLLGQLSDSGSANQMTFSGLLLLIAAIRLPSGILGSDLKKTKAMLGSLIKS